MVILSHFTNYLKLGASVFSLSVLWVFPGGAEEARSDEKKEFVLDEIVVTGEKTIRSMKDTSSSVTVIGSKDIENKAGISSVADAIQDIPNVTFNGTVGAPIIRGQDTQGPNFGSMAFFGGTMPRATINLDGRYLNYYEYVYGASSIWDVNSIEVFRGPQTTSQGANSIAGAIIVNTKDPTFTPEAAYQTEIGNNNRRRASAVVSGPLIEDELAARLAVDYSGRDTFIDFINPKYHRGETNPNFRSFDARAKLLWTPKAIPGLSAKLTYSHSFINRPTWETASKPYKQYKNATLSMPTWKQEVDAVVGEVNYDFGNGIKLFNQTQYSTVIADRVLEPINTGAAVIKQKNISNETRLTFGDAASTLSGFAGLYLARTKSDETLYLRGTTIFDDEKRNLGLYSEVTYRLTDRWTLTGGLRYQRDRIEREGTTNLARSDLDYDRTFDALLPKVSLAYDVTSDVRIGAMVSKGYNPGGVNLRMASRDFVTFNPETVWNYEIFGRVQLLDKRLNLNTNIFYSDHKNSQRLLPDYFRGVQLGSYVVNADRAKSYGLEVSMDYLVTNELRVKAGAGLLRTEIEKFTVPGGATFEGNEFGNAPGYTLNIGADWNITPELKLSGEVRYTDGYYSTDENYPAYKVKGYAVANVRMGYKPTDRVEFYAFANNIFDKRTPTYFYDDRSIGGIVANMLEPRTFGIGIRGSL